MTILLAISICVMLAVNSFRANLIEICALNCFIEMMHFV